MKTFYKGQEVLVERTWDKLSSDIDAGMRTWCEVITVTGHDKKGRPETHFVDSRVFRVLKKSLEEKP